MSGEGLLADRPHMPDRAELGDCCAAQLADVLAYLARKQRNAEMVGRRDAGEAERARDIARQFAVVADELRAGFHEGEAAVAAQLQEKS